jgi:peptide/nickel transport system permease protein
LADNSQKESDGPILGKSLWTHARDKIVHDKIALASLCVIGLYVGIAIVSPFVFTDWGSAHDYGSTNLPPSLKHLFGTDALGRSVLQKTFLGAYISMSVGFWSNAIAIPLGMLLGAIAGFFGRVIDDFIVWLYSTLASIPGIILLIALKFAFEGKTFGPFDLSGMTGICLAIGVLGWINTCRLVRAETMKLKEIDYIQAAKACGRKNFSILIRHIMPNVMHIGIINFSLGFISAISSEVILSYLNLGIHDKPSWGKMINEARMDLVVGRWWEMSAAVLATFIIVLAWNIFGDRLRDALDPRLKNL